MLDPRFWSTARAAGLFLVWLVALPLITPRDFYFPVLHHVAPLLIGIALLWRAA